MSVKLNARKVGDVTVVDAVGRITLGEGASTFRDAIRDLSAKVIAIVECHRSGPLQGQHSLDVPRHCIFCAADIVVGIALPQFECGG